VINLALSYRRVRALFPRRANLPAFLTRPTFLVMSVPVAESLNKRRNNEVNYLPGPSHGRQADHLGEQAWAMWREVTTAMMCSTQTTAPHRTIKPRHLALWMTCTQRPPARFFNSTGRMLYGDNLKTRLAWREPLMLIHATDHSSSRSNHDGTDFKQDHASAQHSPASRGKPGKPSRTLNAVSSCRP